MSGDLISRRKTFYTKTPHHIISLIEIKDRNSKYFLFRCKISCTALTIRFAETTVLEPVSLSRCPHARIFAER